MKLPPSLSMPLPAALSSTLTAALAIALLLAGCATAPKPPEPFAAPAEFKESGIWKRAAASSLPPVQAQAQVQVPDEWWRMFGDPVLDNLQLQLVIGNENLKSAVAQVEITDLAGDGDHYAARVVSESFRGMNRVAQQRAVYAALGGRMGGVLHALQLTTAVPN